MRFEELLRVVDGLAGLSDPTESSCRAVLGDARAVELDLRHSGRAGIAVLTLDPAADLAGFARDVAALGEPAGIDLVSPPAMESRDPTSRPSWDRKWSVCHVRAGGKVWFGLEQQDGQTRLVSVSVHYR